MSGYPTLKIFRGGEMSQDYDGPRDANGIIQYMKKNAGPSSVELKDVDQLNKKLDGDAIVVVGKTYLLIFICCLLSIYI